MQARQCFPTAMSDSWAGSKAGNDIADPGPQIGGLEKVGIEAQVRNRWLTA